MRDVLIESEIEVKESPLETCEIKRLDQREGRKTTRAMNGVDKEEGVRNEEETGR